jgi:hypothetical protein
VLSGHIIAQGRDQAKASHDDALGIGTCNDGVVSCQEDLLWRILHVLVSGPPPLTRTATKGRAI